MSLLKKASIGIVLVLLVVCVGLFFWARTILATEAVRNAIASQISTSLGQPVAIGRIDVAFYPRLTVNLGDVRIGQPAKIRVDTLHVGTDLRALLSRRIEHARVNLTRARIELPLPEFAIGSTSAPPAAGDAARSSPIEIVSIDELRFSEVDIVSGGRTLHGDVEVVPRGPGLVVRKVALTADNARIDVSGEIADLAGPTGALTIKAGALDIGRLVRFVSDFSGGSGVGTVSAGAAAPRRSASTSKAMDLRLAIEADRATMGALALDKLTGRAHATPRGLTIEPASFGVFAGRVDGSLALSLGAQPDFRLAGKLSNIDVAVLTAFAGSPNTISGTLAGQVDVAGQGMDLESVMKSARGTSRVEIANGTIRNLGLIQSVIVATSGRAGAKVSAADVSRDEPFTRLGGTMTIANGSASTHDLKMESKNVLLDASGAVRLDGTSIDLAGQVQLSDELSKQAGRDLVRYTQDSQGRVTLPVTIGGSAANPQVGIDTVNLAKRAITNKAKEEAEKALRRGLKSLFKKK